MAPKAPRTTKKILMFPVSTYAPIVIDKPFWTEAFVGKDYFWAQVEKNRTEVDVPFEQSSSSFGEVIPREHQTPFIDHKGGEGMLLHPRSV